MKTALLALLLLTLHVPPTDADTCSYSTYRWNVHQKKGVEFREVQHPYSELQAFEIDQATGCTVCREDQVAIHIGDLPAVLVCRRFARNIELALNDLLERGAPIRSVVAYRVGMTRGKVDEFGNRTRFSNHSFGIAIDINEQHNGLYGRCLTFGPHCRLRRGGEWNPANPASLTRDSLIVQTLQAMGFSWGGEIKGNQKDFMHFSPTGY